jgi:integrase
MSLGRPLAKLSATRVEKLAKSPGMHGDGGGLWLCVSSKYAASWILRYSLGGKTREMGLGGLADVSLADAREKATEARRLRGAGMDPIVERDRKAAAARLEAARAITFKEAAETYIADHGAGWKNDKHAAQWPQSLKAYAYPIIGKLPVGAIDVAVVTKVLRPIWTKKPETASRLRGRIEAILDWATANGYRQGENPARWRGHLEAILPKRSKVRRVTHHAALPYSEMPDFWRLLEGQPGEAARALRFLILTAARTGEVIGATGKEIDRERGMWTVPAERMKAGKEHRLPLPAEALALLPNEMADNAPIFPSPNGKHLTNMAMLTLLRRMKRSDLTVHGFRSTFRDWAAEKTDFPAEVPEMALAHAVGDKVEAAYRRGDLFEKRRALAQDWACYCTGRPQ